MNEGHVFLIVPRSLSVPLLLRVHDLPQVRSIHIYQDDIEKSDASLIYDDDLSKYHKVSQMSSLLLHG
jgi:hypothetical protein